MKSSKASHNISTFIILLFTLIASIGSSFSIGKYGIFVPLFVLLSIQFIWQTISTKKIALGKTDIILYLVYIIVFWICSLNNGDGNSGRTVLTINYLICILMYIMYARSICSQKIIENIIKLFIIVLLFDCIVTIAQYYNNHISWAIWYMFNDAETVQQSELINDLTSDSQEIGTGYIFCPGIFPSQVYNGYIVASIGMLVSYFSFHTAKRIINKRNAIVTLIITVYTLFVIQQRMAFALFVIALCLMFYTKHKIFSIILATFLFIIFISYGIDFNNETLGRFADFEDNIREKIYRDGIEYISQHLGFGGRIGYLKMNQHSIHNVFMNAFLYGGATGAILISIIYFRMCFKCITIIIQYYNNPTARLSIPIAYALLTYNLISLIHNNSLLTGDPIIWILYSLLLISTKYNYVLK